MLFNLFYLGLKSAIADDYFRHVLLASRLIRISQFPIKEVNQCIDDSFIF